jgi:uncharacterized protein
MKEVMKAFPRRSVKLLPGILKERFDVNRYYLMSLESDALVFNHKKEAVLAQTGLSIMPAPGERSKHGGWEDPGCQVRGQFLGHWLSAAARIWASTGDKQIKEKADFIIDELEMCQNQNGNGWLGSIPEKYLEKVVLKQPAWAPHYTLHKTMMGLYEMYSLGGNKKSLTLMEKFADWFYKWTSKFSRKEMDDILDYETGGMLEALADLYGVTGNKKHRELLDRYYRGRLFDEVLKGNDVLSKRHANTMIPEIYGAARCYEVTGDEKFRKIAEKFWHAVVPSRMYSTGGHTSDEAWSEPNKLVPTLGDKNQEFCTAYNMMWLSQYLLRWSGDPKYGDYYERNLINGILTGQRPDDGMITYYHAFKTGGIKKWGTPRHSFWCCYGTGVQAFAELNHMIYLYDDENVFVNLYASSELDGKHKGAEFKIVQHNSMPNEESSHMMFLCPKPVKMGLSLRIPYWATEGVKITVNDKPEKGTFKPTSFYTINRTWEEGDVISITLPNKLYSCPTPDDMNLVSVLYGPIVLAGITPKDVEFKGDTKNPEKWMKRISEEPLRFKAKSTEGDIEFMPMYEVIDQKFGIYFRVKK